VRIELPAAWEASVTYTVLAVVVGACREHARELQRRSDAVLAARADLHSLLTIVDASVSIEADLRARLAVHETGEPADVTCSLGAGMIAAERASQLAADGRRAEHDDGHGDGELARAAAAYATPVDHRWLSEDQDHELGWVPTIWPWEGSRWRPQPHDRVAELVTAGSLIAAEIDRLLRARERAEREWESAGGSEAR
jgi:hypothetical protein